MRVVESSAFIAAPLGGLSLAELGADVIRIDMIGGGIDYGRMPLAPSGRSYYWTGLNKGKRSVAINLRAPEGRDLVRALVVAPGEDGGILLTNVTASWLTHAALSRERPDLISCTIEGNQDGSTAVDYTVNSACGFPAITGGGTARQPVNHVLPAWDMAAAQHAALALVAAVNRRQRTGEGAEVRLALSDVGFATLSHLGYIAEAELEGADRPSVGNYIYGAFGRDFESGDGKSVMVAAISSRQWSALVDACGISEETAKLENELGLDFAREPDRFAAREAIAALLEGWCSARSFSEIAAAFARSNVCWGPYQTVRDALAEDPRASIANPIFSRVETPGIGTHLSAGSALRFEGLERQPPGYAPLLGEHTDEVLAEVLGLGSGEIGRLHDAGIVSGVGSKPAGARL
jgi:2-methylfumaryl-CoA isomerase